MLGGHKTKGFQAIIERMLLQNCGVMNWTGKPPEDDMTVLVTGIWEK